MEPVPLAAVDESRPTPTPASGGDGDTDFERLIDSIGGHGPFQVFMWTVSFGTKACVATVFLYMSFAGATPDFWCAPPGSGSGSGSGGRNVSDVIVSDVIVGDVAVIAEEEGEEEEARWRQVWNVTRSDLWRACHVNGMTACSAFRFDKDMDTVVSEVGILLLLLLSPDDIFVCICIL